MRKYFLGIAIGIVFLAYSVTLRHQHSESIVPPTSVSRKSSTASSTPVSNPAPSPQYKDGTYTGSIANAYYGNLQVSATISGGKITTVNFLQYPDENPNSIYVNTSAIPYLKQEAIKAQSSKVSTVTGATFTSQAFIQSLASALRQARQG